MTISLSDLWSPEQVAAELAKVGEISGSLNGMMELFEKNEELFYNLACVSVPRDSPDWMKRCAAFAARFVRLPFKYTNEYLTDETGGWVTWRDEGGSMRFDGVSVDQVREFMNTLNGTSSPNPATDPDWKRGKSIGRSVSNAQVYFRLFAGQEEAVV